jgi:hypothetical protein
MKHLRISSIKPRSSIYNNDLDYFKVEGLFWVHFQKHRISFWVKGFPEELHYTIAFNDESRYVNLHISKNCSDPKPRITVVYAEKKLLEELIPLIIEILLKGLIEPINIQSFLKDGTATFISNSKIKRSRSYTLFEKRLIEHFRPITEIKRRKRLKIVGEIETHLEQFIQNGDNSRLITRLAIDDRLSNNTDTVIHHADGTTQAYAFRTGGKWYRFGDTKPMEMLRKFMVPELPEKIFFYLKRSIVVVRDAKSYQDTEPFNHPIQLVKNSN